MNEPRVLIAITESNTRSRPAPTLELVFEDTHVRVRIREPSGKASIFLNVDDLTLLAEQALLMRERLLDK